MTSSNYSTNHPASATNKAPAWVVPYLKAGADAVIAALENKGFRAEGKRTGFARFQAGDIGCHASSGTNAPAVTISETNGKLQAGCFTCEASVLEHVHGVLQWSNEPFSSLPVDTSPDNTIPDPVSIPTMGELRSTRRWMLFTMTAPRPATEKSPSRPSLKIPSTRWAHPRIDFVEYEATDGKKAFRPADPGEQGARFVGRRGVTTATPDTWLDFYEASAVADALQAKEAQRRVPDAMRDRHWPTLVHSHKGPQPAGLTTAFLDLDQHTTDADEVAWIQDLKDKAKAAGLKATPSQSGVGRHFVFAIHPADAHLWDKLWNGTRSTGGSKKFDAGFLREERTCKNQAKSHKHSYPACFYSPNAKVEMWTPDGDGRAQITKLDYYDDGTAVLDTDPIPILRFHDFLNLAPEVESQVFQRFKAATLLSPPAAGAPQTAAGALAPGSIQDWFEAGLWMSSLPEFGNFRYDSITQNWYEWVDDRRWLVLISKNATPSRLITHIRDQRINLDRTLAVLSVQGQDKDGNLFPVLQLSERNLNREKSMGLIDGIAAGRDRPFPDYQNDASARAFRLEHIAVPSGIVNVRTGNLTAHDRDTSNTIAVTQGDYRPADLQYLQGVLWSRFRLVMDAAIYARFIDYLGLLASGKAQSYRALWAFFGGPGCGKGGGAGLLVAAFGDRATVLSNDYLSRISSDIDATTYNLITRQPLLIVFDELAGGEKVNMAKLLSLTGNNNLPSSRMPHQTVSVQGTIPSVAILTCVEPPSLRRGTGLERRLATFPFPFHVDDGDKDTEDFKQELLDAVVTVAISGAKPVFAKGYTPPTPDTTAQANFLKGADDLVEWINSLPDTWHNQPTADALDAWNTFKGGRRLSAKACLLYTSPSPRDS